MHPAPKDPFPESICPPHGIYRYTVLNIEIQHGGHIDPLNGFCKAFLRRFPFLFYHLRKLPFLDRHHGDKLTLAVFYQQILRHREAAELHGRTLLHTDDIGKGNHLLTGETTKVNFQRPLRSHRIDGMDNLLDYQNQRQPQQHCGQDILTP